MQTQLYKALGIGLAFGVLFAAPAQAAYLSPREARTAARKAGEQGPFELKRLARDRIYLVYRESDYREWTDDCPFPSCDATAATGGQCKWTETTTTTLEVWVRETRRGYRVRDNLDWADFIPKRRGTGKTSRTRD